MAGVAEGCVRAGCALIGGETAEHPGHLGPDDFDLAGAATGVVEADRLLGPHRVRAGDAVIGLASSGLHANGYSLARQVLDQTGLALDAEPPELGTSVGEELLTPTAIYSRDCLALAAGCDVHALAHITGGGLAANLARVLPPGTGAVLDRATWRPPPVFSLLAGRGGIDAAEMERVFNMGVGMAAVVAADDADRALRVLAARDVTGWVLGGDHRARRRCAPGRGSPRLTDPGREPRGQAGTGRQEPTLLVVLVRLLAVGVVAVAVHEVSVGGLTIVVVGPAHAQFGPQPVEVGPAAVVLELAGHLHLLGLGSAAPHWLDPLEHAEPRSGSCSLH